MWSLHSSYWANISCFAQPCVCGFFFNGINFVGNQLTYFWFILNMMPHYWVGDWLQNKRYITDFRMAWLIMWAVSACCRISWPVQLRQAYTSDKSTRTIETWDQEAHRWWTTGEKYQTTWRYCGEVLNGHSGRWKLKTWFRRTTSVSHTFCTWYLYWGERLLQCGHCSVLHLYNRSLKALEWS